MKSSIYILFLTLTFSNILSAKIVDHEETLNVIASKLSDINKKLDDPRVIVSPKSFNWPELQQLRQDFMFVAAHDPSGKISKEISQELNPQSLTSKVQESFLILEASAKGIGTLVQTEEWQGLKKDIEFFISNRKIHFYGPAREIIRSGSVSRGFQEVERIAGEMILKNDNEKSVYTLKVLDPFFDEMAKELKVMNRTVSKIQHSLIPKPAIKESIFKIDNYQELSLTSLFSIIIGISLTLGIQKLSQRPKETPVKEEPIQSFDYSDWLQKLEISLKTFKANDEKTIESYLKLKEICKDFSNSRKAMNLAESQKEFYSSLDTLNIHAPKIEEHFENFDIARNAELSRKLVKLIIQLCEALEKNQQISFSGSPKAINNKTKTEKILLRVA
jgi:hypothetical protein